MISLIITVIKNRIVNALLYALFLQYSEICLFFSEV